VHLAQGCLAEKEKHVGKCNQAYNANKEETTTMNQKSRRSDGTKDKSEERGKEARRRRATRS